MWRRLLAVTSLRRPVINRKERAMPAFSIHPASGGYRAHFWGDNHPPKLIWSTQVYEDERDAEYAVALLRQYAKNAPLFNVARVAAMFRAQLLRLFR